MTFVTISQRDCPRVEMKSELLKHFQKRSEGAVIGDSNQYLFQLFSNHLRVKQGMGLEWYPVSLSGTRESMVICKKVPCL